MTDNKRAYFLAIDVGATSGRAILENIENDTLRLTEINRFPNIVTEINGRMYWDLFYLYNEILKSLKMIESSQINIQSIGIDTWGGRFCLLWHRLRSVAHALQLSRHHDLWCTRRVL